MNPEDDEQNQDIDGLTTILEQLVPRMTAAETRIDQQEQMLASLSVAYAETWVAIENVVHTVLATKTPEEQQVFNTEFLKLRQAMLADLQKASEGGLENLRPDLAETLERLAQNG